MAFAYGIKKIVRIRDSISAEWNKVKTTERYSLNLWHFATHLLTNSFIQMFIMFAKHCLCRENLS